MITFVSRDRTGSGLWSLVSQRLQTWIAGRAGASLGSSKTICDGRAAVPGRTDARRRVRRIPYRFVAYAVTIAALSTGVAAFATMDKTVRLDVDGHIVAVRTFAGDVSGVLRKA